jgi:hypothetical protein
MIILNGTFGGRLSQDRKKSSGQSADFGPVPSAIAVDADKISVDKHGRLPAEGAFGSVGLEFGIGNFYIFGRIVVKVGMGHGKVSCIVGAGPSRL